MENQTTPPYKSRFQNLSVDSTFLVQNKIDMAIFLDIYTTFSIFGAKRLHVRSGATQLDGAAATQGEGVWGGGRPPPVLGGSGGRRPLVSGKLWGRDAPRVTCFGVYISYSFVYFSYMFASVNGAKRPRARLAHD